MRNISARMEHRMRDVHSKTSDSAEPGTELYARFTQSRGLFGDVYMLSACVPHYALHTCLHSVRFYSVSYI